MKNDNKNKRSKSRSNNSRRCYNCSETDHYVKFCENPKKNDSNEHANVHVVTENNMRDVYTIELSVNAAYVTV